MSTPEHDPERRFLEALLDVHEAGDPATSLPGALATLLEVLDAERGYVELVGRGALGSREWHAALGCDADSMDGIRAAISRGIIARAVEEGRVLQTTSAMADPRFAARESVRRSRIDAVLCAPVRGELVSGVVYVEGRRRPGPFSAAGEESAARLARALSLRADGLLAQQRASAAPASLPGLVCRSEAMQALAARARLCASLDAHLLISGPSGTGKSQLARVLHQLSPRAGKPLVEVNCAALPEALVESELFGSARGAHSAVAHGAVEGKVAAAEGGTLLLDEVGELTLPAQAKLLQLLQDRSYHRLGDAQRRVADVRILAATNQDLEAAVRERRFREDLYYRLRVIELAVPSLAARREDLPALIHAFVEDVRQRHRAPDLRISPAAEAALEVAEWPGNARQLAHALEGGAVAARVAGRTQIEVGDVPGLAPAAPGAVTLEARLAAHRRQVVQEALTSTDWNVTEAARRLDVSRSFLYRLIDAFGLDRPDR